MIQEQYSIRYQDFVYCLFVHVCIIMCIDKQSDWSKLLLKTSPVFSTDLVDLQNVCKKHPLGQQVLNVGPVNTRGAVVIHNPHPATTTESFLFYLKNSKRSGGTVLDIERDENHRFLIAYYASKDGKFVCFAFPPLLSFWVVNCLEWG